MNEIFKSKELITTQLGLSIENWKPEESRQIYEQLEHPNWAPWLEASKSTIQGRATVFPEGQLLIKDGTIMVASLSMNQINWDGNPNSLPNWDQVAGNQSTDYSETYNPDGNALVLMSMNVAPEAQGKQLPSRLIQYTKNLAVILGVDYVIGSFRPSGYGQFKKENGLSVPFWKYCLMNKPGTDKPLDPWLRSLCWNGMQLLKEDSQAMKTSVTRHEFENFKHTYKPDNWFEIKPGIWECGEVGSWTITSTQATYKESNAWGYIPFK